MIKIIRCIKSFLLMIQFLTRVPVNLNLPCEKDDFRRGIAFFPLIGLLVGGLQLVVYHLFNYYFPTGITAVFVVLMGVLITGGLHIDGLGDTCDGFFAFKGSDKVLEIMKDSRIGTYAALAIVFDLLLKILCTYYVIEREVSLLIIVVPLLSRTLFPVLFCFGKRAKSNGTGNLFIGNASIVEVLVSSAIGISLAIFLIGFRDVITAYVVGLVFVFLFNFYCNKRIKGLTGDNLGAFNEVAEILIFLVFL